MQEIVYIHTYIYMCIYLACFICNYLCVLHMSMVWYNIFIYTWHILHPVVVFSLMYLHTINTNTDRNSVSIQWSAVVRYAASFWPWSHVMYYAMYHVMYCVMYHVIYHVMYHVVYHVMYHVIYHVYSVMYHEYHVIYHVYHVMYYVMYHVVSIKCVLLLQAHKECQCVRARWISSCEVWSIWPQCSQSSESEGFTCWHVGSWKPCDGCGSCEWWLFVVCDWLELFLSSCWERWVGSVNYGLCCKYCHNIGRL
jgi:hypothetical protein